MNYHYIQLELIKYLSLNPNSPFSKLIFLDLPSNQVAYHLKELITQKLIIKDESNYSLSKDGKKIANIIDMWASSPKQNREPKISIKCHVFKGIDINSELAVVQRLKEPYYGFHGVMASSVNFERTLTENVEYELPRKLGLTSNDINYVGVSHVINKIDDEVVDSKIFHLFNVFNAKGELISPEGYNNFWCKSSEFLKIEKIHYGEREVFNAIKSQTSNIFIENINHIESL